MLVVCRCRSRAYIKRQLSGFTLLELLVVMSLLSMLMVGLVSAMRTMAQTEAKIDQRLERLDEMRAARAFLMQTLSRVSASKIEDPSITGKKTVPFVASADVLIWVGIMPARPSIGGRYFFRVALEAVGDKSELVLRFALCDPEMTPPNWSISDSRVLVKDIQKFQVYAKGPQPKMVAQTKPWPAGWQNGWPVGDALPDQVKLSLTDANGNMHDWTSSVYPLTQSHGPLSLVVVGGT